MTLINIDPNVRLADNQTFAGFEDIKEGWPEVNSIVRVSVEETDLYGIGTVTAIDNEKQLIFIKVNWSEITSFPAPLIDYQPATDAKDSRRERVTNHLYESRTGRPARYMSESEFQSWSKQADVIIEVYEGA